MKILCDVCSKKEASVFCTADEAALCDGCDQSIHHANKLASKHQRFSLLQPSHHPSLSPLCDICQEKRAILFCQQDRAILCRECEIPLHTANEHTKKHNRFLLTGIKLSSTTIVSENTSNRDDITIITNNNNNNNNNNTDEGETTDTVPNFKFTGETSVSELSGNYSHPNSATTTTTTTTTVGTDNSNNNTTAVSSANNNNDNHNKNNQLINNNNNNNHNISEYLIDMLPGWHFEELLADSASPPAFDFPKNGGNKLDGFEVNEDVLSFFDVENEDRDFTSAFGHQSENFWVPQAGPVITPGINSNNVFGQQPYSSGIHHHSFTSGLIHDPKHHQQQQQHSNITTMKMNRKCLKDDIFAVPQINSSVGFKRNRPFW